MVPERGGDVVPDEAGTERGGEMVPDEAQSLYRMKRRDGTR
jgi:hypothetical protein